MTEKQPTFIDFKEAINKQFTMMSNHILFRTEATKDESFDTYLNKFPDGSNPRYRERTEHDCQCCKQFIRACGNVVAIIDDELVSIWDIEIGGAYQVVADAMSAMVKSYPIHHVFLHYEKNLGTDHNHQQVESGEIIKWDHFHFELPGKFVKSKDTIPTRLADFRSNKDVLKRALDEISYDSIEVVYDLIKSNSFYRCKTYQTNIALLKVLKANYLTTPVNKHDHFAWLNSIKQPSVSKIRNTSIGTLLVDLTEGMALDDAVKKFEAMVAPENYKRPTALITQSMIKKAQDKLIELGLENTLQRRYAVTDDITINNVLYADRSVKKVMNVFDTLAQEVPVKSNKKNLTKMLEYSIDRFLTEIMPKADSIEILFENKHQNNLMNLVAPINIAANSILQWNNNFTWNYNGEVADSMKERVTKAGGNAHGILRFTIQWNDGDDNQNDFDAHCIEPSGNLIYYPNVRRVHESSGVLDVDIQSPGRSVAVENITYTDKSKIQEGVYVFLVHNYSHNGGKTGFTAELEYEGKIYNYSYPKNLKQSGKVTVVTVEFDHLKNMKIVNSLESTETSKQIWNINTHVFHKVSMIMNSPNHWDDQKFGNKHWFFIINNCKNEGSARGFYNEFLNNSLTEHKKVFEVLGSKMKTEPSDKQLSGLGFSETKKNSVMLKITGSFTRTIKVNF